MSRKFLSLLFFFFLLFFSCQKESDSIQKIDPPFQEYIDRFAKEASSRGVNVNLQSLVVTFSDTLQNYCGYGVSNSVQISSRVNCWQNQTDANKEILMFHELGHAILHRSHDNSILSNGDYKTMMLDGNQFSLYSEDTPERRKYYLDELFNASTPPPSWASQKTISTVLINDTINKNSTNWKFVLRSGSSQLGEISTAVPSRGSSLKISTSTPSTFSYWYYEFTPTGIKQSAKLILKVNIRLEQVAEGGVYFALKGDGDTKSMFFVTTQYVRKIVGTTDFIEYNLDLPYYIDKTKKIYIFLSMDDKATGTAYFDDISLVKWE
jgi:hypothetical protein